MSKKKATRLTKAEQAELSKAFIREQGASWKAYNRLSAYECRQRRVDYDEEACAQAWLAHIAVYRKYNEPPPLTPRELFHIVNHLSSSTGQSA